MDLKGIIQKIYPVELSLSKLISLYFAHITTFFDNVYKYIYYLQKLLYNENKAILHHANILEVFYQII